MQHVTRGAGGGLRGSSSIFCSRRRGHRPGVKTRTAIYYLTARAVSPMLLYHSGGSVKGMRLQMPVCTTGRQCAARGAPDTGSGPQLVVFVAGQNGGRGRQSNGKLVGSRRARRVLLLWVVVAVQNRVEPGRTVTPKRVMFREKEGDHASTGEAE